MRRAFGEGSTGKGVATAIRGAAGALRDLEGRQKSRATRVQRDSLDRALLDLAGFYRDVLAVQFGADVELANAGDRNRISQLAAAAPPEVTVRRIEAIMKCRERLAVAVAPLLAVEEMTIALVGDQRPRAPPGAAGPGGARERSGTAPFWCALGTSVQTCTVITP